MDNIRTILDFLRDQGIPSDDFGRYRFNATVWYESSLKGDREDQTQVTVSMASSENGKVGLGETGQLNADWCHLDFHPDYQEFEYDPETDALVVSGSSQKMGDYEVRIVPV